MAVATGTGLGGVLTAFNIGSFTVAAWKYVSITGHEETVAVIDDTHLGSTTFEESIPASLASLGEITFEMQWAYDQAIPGGAASAYTPSDEFTMTVSLPDRTGLVTGTISGLVTVTSVSMPDHTSADRSIGTMAVKFVAGTGNGPTYTKSS